MSVFHINTIAKTRPKNIYDTVRTRRQRRKRPFPVWTTKSISEAVTSKQAEFCPNGSLPNMIAPAGNNSDNGHKKPGYDLSKGWANLS